MLALSVVIGPQCSWILGGLDVSGFWCTRRSKTSLKDEPMGIEIWRELKERAGTYGASIPVSLELFTNQGRC